MTEDKIFGNLNRKRRLNIIKCIINNQIILQNKLIDKFEKDGLTGGKNPSKSISDELSKLENEGIIQRETNDTLRGRPKEIKIVESPEAMIKIIKEISTLEKPPILNEYKREFINSEYAQKLINNDLVTLIELRLNEYMNTDIKLTFSNEERALILNILQSSFSAIYYAIFESKMFIWFNIDSDLIIENIKRLFIEFLILRLGDDRVSSITNQKNKFNYEITVKFSENTEPSPHKLIIDKDKVTSNYHNPIEDT